MRRIGRESPSGVLAIRSMAALPLSVLLFVTTQANAFESLWLSESLKYLESTEEAAEFVCQGCHTGISQQSALKVEAPASVALGATSTNIRLNGFLPGNKLSSFRYRVGDGVPSDAVNNVRLASNQIQEIQFSSNESPVVVHYCLLDANNDERRWNCDKVSIKRENSPPVILSAIPQDIVATVGDTPASFVLSAQDEESIPEIVVRSSNASVVGVDDRDAPLYRLNYLSAGEVDIEITVTDSDGAVVSAGFEVIVNSPPPVDPPEPGNQKPELTLETTTNPLNMRIGDTSLIDVKVTDEQVASLEFRVSSSAEAIATASFTVAQGLTIQALSDGIARIDLEAEDDVGQTASVSLSVRVLPAIEPPTAQADVFVIDQSGGQVELDVLKNDVDPDGGELTIELVSAQSAQGADLRVEGQRVIYQPVAALTEQDTFSYRVVSAANLRSAEVQVRLMPSDIDGDGVVDALDNCPNLKNPDQNDLDSDRAGDLCDIDPDGDGTPGISGEPFVSGRDLVQSQCLSCHLTAVNGAPKFNDESAWDQRIRDAGGRPEDMLDSVVNGMPNAMEAFGERYSTIALLRAVLYLSGREENTEPREDELDSDDDGIPDSQDNCPTVHNSGQLDSDSNQVGDACEPLADRDGDGYPYRIDDDDGNARRLIAALPVVANASNSSVFTSEGALAIGRVARRAAAGNDFTRASIMMSVEELRNNAPSVFNAIEIGEDAGFSTLMGVMNIDADASTGVAEWILHLNTPLPNFPALRILDVNTGSWAAFDQTGNNQLSSAAATGGRCPALNSANYQPALNAGDVCVRVSLTDGGRHDADQAVNGRVELLGNIAAQSQRDGSPPTVDTSPSKSGGNALWLLYLLLPRLLARPTTRYRSRP